MNETNRLRALLLVIAAVAAAIIVMIAINALPESAINRNETSRVNMVSLAPQGWAFFTRNAREEKYFIYQQQPDSSWQLASVPGASLRYLFGLNRKGRASSLELKGLVGQTTDSMWVNTNKKIEAFFSATATPLPVYAVKNRCPDPVFTGNILIQKRQLVPWAWANLNREVIMSSKVVKLYVQHVPAKH
ncbi:SdpA family antimicrobial peptide system protein [Chitinophaga rhizophila]|uniref:SdpA family antimicrobial peptide system protein n=1 Tax=Chitinophaga rhizophila TaxID=2866212 RepID=A0ABS7GFC2_9BACT|nr:SdpA family antimicrobial peptide system protein [Chitinophaga rhizophila]MBW8686392.1 SdpA family antimicrobial peptide system protein [Chitinophaga rhizophila]